MDDDLRTRHHDGPVDDAAAASLERIGLELRLVPNARPAVDGWLHAVSRGFLDPEPADEQIAASMAAGGYRRRIGVFDPGSPQSEVPVGTFASWAAEVSVPGGVAVPMAAISAVTVAPTHQRRGIARAMMEGKLRHAASLGIPLAGLTVSESTIYGRYGFAPAVPATEWVIDTKRATWAGPVAPGRVDAIPRDLARRLAPVVHERIRVHRPGEIAIPPGHWDRFTGTNPDADKPGRIRAVQYADPSGTVRGVALYTATENHDDFTKSRVRITSLVAEDAQAYAGLWRYFIELALIATVTASELSTDEPLWWMISDQRAATITLNDHHYLRVLDIPAALQGRRYHAAGAVVLDVADPVGISGGRWLLETDAAGIGRVRPDDGPDASDIPVVRLGTTELSAAYLGAVSLATLAAAGRVETTDAAAAARVLSWPEAPQLSFWY
ncbi:GNAT family N-acetyltransferase [Microbacterium elymi]|uniref:GNAT family N-acetyltransferase n=1 Tax=Microbacterium elymi TaxID=2909587 RepID=A0ABY5NKK3_9MICO|nr:GNAT family N-acetyltransferase [Microbacterium elymi]UUT35606.1 GNAT family N-acetyltransferase [Microbacterium elymi]